MTGSNIVSHQLWLKKRKHTTIVFAIQSVLIGCDYGIVFVNLWLYIETLVRPLHQKFYYSLIAFCYILSSAILSTFICKYADQSRNIRRVFLLTNTAVIVGDIIYMLPFSPWLLVLGRVIAAGGLSQRSIIMGELVRCYAHEELTQKITLIGMALAFGFIVAPGINSVFTSLDVSIGKCRITFANASGLYMPALFIIAQTLCVFLLHDLSKEYDLKAELEKSTNSFQQHLDTSFAVPDATIELSSSASFRFKARRVSNNAVNVNSSENQGYEEETTTYQSKQPANDVASVLSEDIKTEKIPPKEDEKLSNESAEGTLVSDSMDLKTSVDESKLGDYNALIRKDFPTSIPNTNVNPSTLISAVNHGNRTVNNENGDVDMTEVRGMKEMPGETQSEHDNGSESEVAFHQSGNYKTTSDCESLSHSTANDLPVEKTIKDDFVFVENSDSPVDTLPTNDIASTPSILNGILEWYDQILEQYSQNIYTFDITDEESLPDEIVYTESNDLPKQQEVISDKVEGETDNKYNSLNSSYKLTSFPPLPDKTASTEQRNVTNLNNNGNVIDEEGRNVNDRKSSILWLLKELLTHYDTCLLLALSLFESFYILMADMIAPMIIVDELKWSVHALNMILLGEALSSILPCLLFICKTFNDRQIFIISVVSIFAYPLITIAQIILTKYSRNFTLNVILCIIYCLLFANVVVIKDIFLAGFLAKMISSKYQALGDSIRFSICRVGALVALVSSPFILAQIHIIGTLYIVIMLAFGVLLIIRRSTLGNPTILIN